MNKMFKVGAKLLLFSYSTKYLGYFSLKKFSITFAHVGKM